MNRRLFASAVLVAALTGAQSHAQTVRSDYRMTVGGSPLPDATLWLYYEVRNDGLTPSKIGDISNGWLHLDVSAEQVLQHDPLPGNSRLILGLKVSNGAWYNAGEVFDFPKLDRQIESLGKVSVAAGVRTIDLPTPVQQVLKLENPDGTPRAGEHVSIASYATSIGHCARPAWLGPIDVTTDAAGIARFRAPLVKLFLMAEHFDAKTQEERTEAALEAGSEHIVRARWVRRPEREFLFKILKSDGSPATAEVVAEGDGCDSASGPLGKTDSQGDVVVRYSPDDVLLVTVAADFIEDRVYLSPSEYLELDRTGKVTITLPRK